MNRGELLGRAAAGTLAWSGPWWRLPGAAADRLSSPLTELARELQGPVIARGAAGYEAARLVYDTRFDAVKPMGIAFCTSATDVAKAIAWARRHAVRLAVRNGGHSYGGYSTTSGVILDVTRIRGIQAAGETATVGAGARLIDVYSGLWTHGR